MKRKASILLSVFVFTLLSCSSGEQDASKGEAQSPIIESTTMPEVTYQTPSVDRSDKSKPEGSPFVPELLQEVFPLDAGGLNRFSAANGTPNLMKGVTGTHSRMVYKNPDGDQEIVLNIYDSGLLQQTMDNIVTWIRTPINRDSANSLDKTGALKGFPSYTTYIKDVQQGEIHILVNKRFEVVATCMNVPLETLQQVVVEWDFSSLY